MKNTLLICLLVLTISICKGQQDFVIFDNATTTTQTATGLSYGRTSSTGTGNVAIGSNSLRNNTTGTNSTAIGTNALFRQVDGHRNTAIGNDALKNIRGSISNFTQNPYTIQRGMDNVAIGHKAMFGRTNANGVEYTVYATDNIAIGGSALEGIEGLPTFSGGVPDQISTTNGTFNIAIGRNALKNTHNGSGNVGIGREALFNTDGYLQNSNVTTSQGRDNIAIGYRALYNNTTGSNNISIGNSSGGSAPTDSYKLYIGNGSTPLIGGDLFNAKVGINKTIASLNTSTAKLQVGGDISCLNINVSSDKRYKKNIYPISNALQKIIKLQGVTYDWRITEFPEMGFTEKKQIGLIAQDVETVFPELVITDTQGYKSVDYQKAVPILLEAIKEINQEKNILKQEIKSIQNILTSLQSMVQESNNDVKTKNSK